MLAGIERFVPWHSALRETNFHRALLHPTESAFGKKRAQKATNISQGHRQRYRIFFSAEKFMAHSFIQNPEIRFFFFPRSGKKKNTTCFFFFPRKSSFAIHSKSGGVSIILLKSKLFFFSAFFCIFCLVLNLCENYDRFLKVAVKSLTTSISHQPAGNIKTIYIPSMRQIRFSFLYQLGC